MALTCKLITLGNFKVFLQEFPFVKDNGTHAMNKRIANILAGEYGEEFEFYITVDPHHQQVTRTYLTGRSLGPKPEVYQLYSKIVNMRAIYEL